MEQQTKSIKFLRQRKFFLVLPAILIPFLTLFFWALDGGKVKRAYGETKKSGFNADLPAANFKGDKTLDKLSYYEKAQKDSAKLKDLIKSDPYYNQEQSPAPIRDSFNASLIGSPYAFKSNPGQSEAKVNDKLAELNRVLNAPQPSANPASGYYPVKNTTSMNSGDIDRLEQMMRNMKQGSGADSEMLQLNSMMDKVLDLQHPELVRERIKAQSIKNKQQALPVTTTIKEDNVSLLVSKNTHRVLDTAVMIPPANKGFYSLNDAIDDNDSHNAIEAIVQETQTISAGATIKLRLLGDMYVSGILISKGTFVYGIANLSGERLTIEIASIRYGSNIFPVALSAYDMDGVAGIYIPGAISRDVAKQSADQSIQNLGLATFDPSIGAQAASAGVAAAKTLFSRKVKLVRVGVKAGYKVLLRDNNRRNQ